MILSEAIYKTKNIRKCRQRQTAVFYLAWIITILALVSIFAIVLDGVKRFQTDYQAITVTVVDTYEDYQVKGATKSRQVKKVPLADVLLADGSIQTIDNDKFKIDEKITVYQSSKDGEVFTKLPSKPGLIEGLTIIAILIFGFLAFFFAKETRYKLSILKNKQLDTSVTFKLKIDKQVRSSLFATVIESDFLPLPVLTKLKISLENGQKAGEFTGEISGFIADVTATTAPYQIFIKETNHWFFAAAEPIQK